MMKDIFKNFRLINKSGFLASSLLNIGAMESVENENNNSNVLKNYSFKDKSYDEIYNFIRKNPLKTCYECTNKIEMDKNCDILLTSIKNEIIKIKEFLPLKGILEELNFNDKNKTKNINKLFILINFFNDKFKLNIKNNYKKNEEYSCFIENLEKIDISNIDDNIYEEIFSNINSEFCFKKIGSGMFGNVYLSEKLPNIVLKKVKDYYSINYSFRLDHGDDITNYSKNELINFLNFKDYNVDFICKYLFNIGGIIQVLEYVKGSNYELFDGTVIKGGSDYSYVFLNQILLNNYSNFFDQIVNKDIKKRYLSDRKNDNILICDHGYLKHIDNDNFSMSENFGQIIDEFCSIGSDTFYYNILTNKKTDFDFYFKMCKYYKIHDVDFIHSLVIYYLNDDKYNNEKYEYSAAYCFVKSFAKIKNTDDYWNPVSEENKKRILDDETKNLKNLINIFKNFTKNNFLKYNNNKFFSLYSIYSNKSFLDKNLNIEDINIFQHNINNTFVKSDNSLFLYLFKPFEEDLKILSININENN